MMWRVTRTGSFSASARCMPTVAATMRRKPSTSWPMAAAAPAADAARAAGPLPAGAAAGPGTPGARCLAALPASAWAPYSSTSTPRFAASARNTDSD